MKKKICLLTIIFTIIYILGGASSAKATDYYARSYIVYDHKTKKVIEGKDYELVRSVASISKIMTAVVAIENASLDQEVKTTDAILKAYGSSIYLQVGEMITMKDLLYGLMLRSGNDAAVTIATGVSSTVEEFVALMNKKAQEIGMKKTIFNNPSGLDIDDDGNLSTSYDMALLMSYALNNDTFREITGTNNYKSQNHGVWQNKNRLIRQYEYTTGGKTGFTTKARRTLVTSAKKDNMELIVVTLDCGGDFSFHKSLYEKNFNKYKTYGLLKEGENYFEEYSLICKNNLSITLQKDSIKDYSIIYEIKGDYTNITLVHNDNQEIIGQCSAIKNNYSTKKKNWLKKILDIIKK